MPSIVVVAHRSSFPEPIRFSPGDQLELGRHDDEYPGWIWVRIPSGGEGWAPEEIIDARTVSQGVARKAYDATELDTRVGERVTCIRELCGWFWVESETGQRGWVPKETIGRIQVAPDEISLMRSAAEEIARSAVESIGRRGIFSISLAGGNTPRALYRLLADGEESYRSRIPWEKTVVIVGDERPVPPDHPDSNYGMIREVLLDSVAACELCRFHTEEGDRNLVVRRFEADLRQLLHAEAPAVPRLDVVVLGLGTDAHTASLFPGSSALTENERLAAAPWVEGVGTHRYTQTPALINGSRRVIFLVSGEQKAEALERVLVGPHDPMMLPAQLVRPTAGEILWFVDEAAAAKLERSTS